MANSAHLVRRQSSRDLNPQRSLDRLELKDMKNRLLLENGGYSKSTYGTASNAKFEEEKPQVSTLGHTSLYL